MTVANWADTYDPATLELALAAGYAQLRDPAHMFDADWHAQQAQRIRQISEAIEARICAHGVEYDEECPDCK